jgi:hypothetical protein
MPLIKIVLFGDGAGGKLQRGPSLYILIVFSSVADALRAN